MNRTQKTGVPVTTPLKTETLNDSHYFSIGNNGVSHL